MARGTKKKKKTANSRGGVALCKSNATDRRRVRVFPHRWKITRRTGPTEIRSAAKIVYPVSCVEECNYRLTL